MNSQPYDWGVPVQQPAAQPHTASTSLRTPLIVVGAVVATIVVVLAGLWVFQAVRPAATSATGWDETQLRGFMEGGEITECDFGSDFYASAGVQRVVQKAGMCSGTVTSSDGHNVNIDVRTQYAPEGDAQTIGDPELVGWKETTDPEAFIPQTLKELDGEGRGMRCQLAGREPILRPIWITVDGPCQLAYPLARQLANLQTFYDFTRIDHGLFDFSRPQYLDVSAPTGEATSALYKDAKQSSIPRENSVALRDAHYDGNTFQISGATITGDGDQQKVCATGTFTLGYARGSWYSRFDLPSLVALFPSGYRVELYFYDHIRLSEGASTSLEMCGELSTPQDSTEFAVVPLSAKQPGAWIIDATTDTA
ncbi:hypothetical protein ACXIUA_00185 [Corynebacterium sp. UMB8791]